MRKVTVLFVTVCICAMISSCNSGGEPQKEPSAPAVNEPHVATQDELDEIFGDIPHKYQNYDKYLVVHPDSETIVTYIMVDGIYETVETMLPDQMITADQYLTPIFEKYEAPEVDRIVFDSEMDMVCVNFTSEPGETDLAPLLESITKTIMEIENLDAEGVCFEVNMQPYSRK